MIYSSPHVYSFGKRTQGTDAYFINKNNKLGPGQYNVKTENEINKHLSNIPLVKVKHLNTQ